MESGGKLEDDRFSRTRGSVHEGVGSVRSMLASARMVRAEEMADGDESKGQEGEEAGGRRRRDRTRRGTRRSRRSDLGGNQTQAPAPV